MVFGQVQGCNIAKVEWVCDFQDQFGLGSLFPPTSCGGRLRVNAKRDRDEFFKKTVSNPR